MSWRTTPATKGWFDAAAKKSGRSLSQEIELTVERARNLQENLGGPRATELLMSLGATAKAKSGDDRWRDAADTDFLIRQTLEQHLYRQRPSSRINPQTGENIRSKLTETRLLLPSTQTTLETIIGRPVRDPIPAEIAPIEIRLPSLPETQQWVMD